MDAIEPFDYAGLVPFSLAYLPGYLADKYDVDQQASAERARKRAEQSASELFLASVSGYDSVTEKDRALDFAQKDVKYALLPVWLLNTKWNGKDYLFAMAGILTGYSGGYFKPANTIARSEVAAILSRMPARTAWTASSLSHAAGRVRVMRASASSTCVLTCSPRTS